MPRSRAPRPFARFVPPRPALRSRNDDEYLFSNPVDAARLREAHADAVAGRNGIAMTREEIWRLAGLEPE